MNVYMNIDLLHFLPGYAQGLSKVFTTSTKRTSTDKLIFPQLIRTTIVLSFNELKNPFKSRFPTIH